MPFKEGESGNPDKVFQPGQTGNPNGRPKGVQNSRTRMMRWLEIEMEEVNPGTGKKERATLLEKMDAAIIKKALKGDLAAYREILDRIEGQAEQKGEVILRFDKDDEKV